MGDAELDPDERGEEHYPTGREREVREVRAVDGEFYRAVAERSEGGGEEGEPGEVELGGFPGRAGEGLQPQRDRHHADREVDEEVVPPAEGRRDHSAEQHPEDGAHAPAKHQEAERMPAPFRREDMGDESPGVREHDRAADGLHGSSGDEELRGRSEAAEARPDREDAETDVVDEAPTEHIADPAGLGGEGGGEQEVDQDRPDDRPERRAELAGHRGEREDDDRAVDRDHQGAQRDQEQDRVLVHGRRGRRERSAGCRGGPSIRRQRSGRSGHGEGFVPAQPYPTD